MKNIGFFYVDIIVHYYQGERGQLEMSWSFWEILVSIQLNVLVHSSFQFGFFIILLLPLWILGVCCGYKGSKYIS